MIPTSSRALRRRHRRMLARACARGGDFSDRGGGFVEPPRDGDFGGARPPYTDFDLFNPEPQSFPASVPEVAALGWSSNVLAGYALQEGAGGAGDTLADFSGNGHTLTIAAAQSKVHRGQRAVGLFDGASFRSQRALEFEGGSSVAQRADVASAAVGNFGASDSWSALVAFRCPAGPPTDATRTIVRKRPNGGGAGWGVGLFTDGRVIATINDGTNSASALATGNHADGAWHWAYVRWDRAANLLRVDTDLTTGITASLSSVGSPANAGTLGLGGVSGVWNAPVSQVRGALVWSDVATTVASIQSWWRHGRAPSWLTYSRASSLHTPVADDPTEGDVLATWGSGQVGYEHNALTSTNALKLGLAVYAAHTNLIPNSDLNDTTNWPATGTRTQYAADSPRGFREAIKHTGTSGQSVLAASGNGASVTSGTTYTASVWCRWDGTGTAPTLEVYRANGTTLITSVNATDGTGKRRRLRVTFSAPATEAIRLAVKGRDGNAWFFGPQINVGAYAMPFVATRGGTASTVAVNARVAAPSGLHADQGTLRVWACFAGQDDTAARGLAVASATAGSNNHARWNWLSSAEEPTASATNGSGATTGNATAGIVADLATVETVQTAWWDKAERYGWALRIARNAGAPATDATDLPTGAALTTIQIGFPGNTNQPNGAISRVRVYPYPELSP